jgi:hypothetical protein
MDAQNIAFMGVRIPNVPACGEWLNRLHHRAASCHCSWEMLLSFVWNSRRMSLLLHDRETRFQTPSYTPIILSGHFPCHLSRSRRHDTAHNNLNINNYIRSPSQLQPIEQCLQGCYNSSTYTVVSGRFIFTGTPWGRRLYRGLTLTQEANRLS